MRGDCSIRVGGIGFTPEQIAATAATKGLLSIELDLSNEIHCGCEACVSQPRPVMSFQELCGLLDQARALGAQRCILVDSKNGSYLRLRDLLTELRRRGMQIELFTDGTAISAEFAVFLRQTNVAIVVRLNLLKTNIDAIDALRRAGYGNVEYQRAMAPPSSPGTPGEDRGGGRHHLELRPPPQPSPGVPGEGAKATAALVDGDLNAPRLAARVAVRDDSIDSVPDWWRRMRSLGVEPYVQVISPPDSATSRGHVVDPERAKRLFDELGRIDREEFGRAWEHPPELTGRSCKRHLFACHVTPCGTIFACVGVTIPLGNIRTESLRTILDESEVLENLRAFGQKVKEPCRTCSKTTDCYGCRGSAYQLTGDYLAGDQLCWIARGTEIPSLPVTIGGVIPHGPRIRMVDRIVSVGERTARTEFLIRADSLFVNGDGRLDETAYIEMIAQSFAASHGFHLSADEQAMHRGMLLGAKDLKVAGTARVGDRLFIDVKKVARFGDFGVVEGTITREDGTFMASGEVKVWRPSGEAEKAMLV